MANPSPNYQISPSQLSTFKDCSMKWYYNYGLSLRPVGSAHYFWVGGYFHELSHFYFDLIKHGMEVGSIALNKAMEHKMKEDLSKAPKQFFPVYVQVHLMFNRYLDRRTEKVDKNIKVLQTETELRYEIIPGVDLMGILDLAFEEKGQLVIRDTKTGASKRGFSQEKMDSMDQLWTYAALWWKIYDQVPSFEVNWISSKVDHKKPPNNDQIFARYRKAVTESDLEAYWNYLVEYITMMRSVDPIRKFTPTCDSCKYKQPCLLSMRGFPVENILSGSFFVAPRGYEFAKFTEVSKSVSDFDLSFD